MEIEGSLMEERSSALPPLPPPPPPPPLPPPVAAPFSAPSLLSVRQSIQSLSIALSQQHLLLEKDLINNKSLISSTQSSFLSSYSSLSPLSSHLCSSRVISSASFCPSLNQKGNAEVAIGDWANKGSIWEIKEIDTKGEEGDGDEKEDRETEIDVSLMVELKGNMDSIVDVSFSPSPLGSPLIATANMGGIVNIYKRYPAIEDTSSITVPSSSPSSPSPLSLSPTSSYSHLDRCGRLCFHPHLPLLFSSSYDQSFRLIDINKEQILLTQPGHLSPLYSLSVHPTGSLLYSGDLSGIGLLWDIRTGKHILSLLNHSSSIHSSSFHPNGYLLATASSDHTVKINDIRHISSSPSSSPLYSIPAHKHLISNVQWLDSSNIPLLSSSPSSLLSPLLLTSSYDRTMSLWDGYCFQCVYSHLSHTDKMTRAIFNPHSKGMILTTSFDKTFKLWKKQKRSKE